MNNLPGFWSVLVPQVRYNTNLNWFEKVLFSEITALTNVSGYCFANNSYFQFVFGISDRTIQRAIKKLESENLIKIDIKRNDNNEVEIRKIFVLFDVTPPDKNVGTPPDKNDATPPDKNVAYNKTRKSNNTSFNNKSNNQYFSQSFKNKRPDVNPDWLADYLKEIEKSN